MSELFQGSGNIIQGLGFAFRRRIAPAGVFLQRSHIFNIVEELILGDEPMQVECLFGRRSG
jgi:hypothetical protein